MSQTPPALRRFSSSSMSRSDSQSLPLVETVAANASPEEAEEYGSVLLDIVSGTAHWSPEAPRRAITPDRNVVIYHGRARHCKQDQSHVGIYGCNLLHCVDTATSHVLIVALVTQCGFHSARCHCVRLKTTLANILHFQLLNYYCQFAELWLSSFAIQLSLEGT